MNSFSRSLHGWYGTNARVNQPLICSHLPSPHLCGPMFWHLSCISTVQLRHGVLANASVSARLVRLWKMPHPASKILTSKKWLWGTWNFSSSRWKQVLDLLLPQVSYKNDGFSEGFSLTLQLSSRKQFCNWVGWVRIDLLKISEHSENLIDFPAAIAYVE